MRRVQIQDCKIPPGARRRRVLAKRRMTERRARLRKAGLNVVMCWIPYELQTQVNQRADALGLGREMVLGTALEIGVRRLTTSDILNRERKWRTIFGLPIAPVRPGHRFDGTRAFNMRAWNAGGRKGEEATA